MFCFDVSSMGMSRLLDTLVSGLGSATAATPEVGREEAERRHPSAEYLKRKDLIASTLAEPKSSSRLHSLRNIFCS